MTKKNIERLQLDRFRALLPDFPKGQVEPSEEPDFLIHRSGSCLGIELTELHRDSPSGVRPPQAQEAMRHRVVAKAAQLYKSAGGPPLRVSVIFNEQHQFTKFDVERLAAQITALVQRNVSATGQSFKEQYDWMNRSYFPEEVALVSVHNIPEITESFFSSPGSTWVATLDQVDVERALAAKESRCATYRAKCTEAWLLINTDIGSLSTWFEQNPQVVANTYPTSFDRVFILSHFAGKLIELRVRS